ncbi:hypothetical protein DFJ73DRAFT_33893 [Zopfochytrium polystomum]|nr:hypothetical protein DFJ73DRAFT_33893 [Zopfochytrium polystomum]
MKDQKKAAAMPRRVDWAPFVVSIAFGQARRRAAAALAVTASTRVGGVSIESQGVTALTSFLISPAAQSALASGAAGSLQAVLSLLLQSSTVLQKRPEEEKWIARIQQLSPSGSVNAREWAFWRVATILAAREAIGFMAFFMVWDRTKSKQTQTRSISRSAQNVAAAAAAAVAYRASIWMLDGKMPSEESGRRGGNPYEPAIAQLRVSVVKSVVSMGVMDTLLGKPSWE